MVMEKYNQIITKTLILFLFSFSSFAQQEINSTFLSNVFTVNYPAAISGNLPPGMILTFKSSSNILGSTSVICNSIGPKLIRKNFDQALVADDIKAGHFVTLIWDSTNDVWQMLSNSANASSGTIQGSGTTNGVAFFSNNNTLTADGSNFVWDNTNKRLGIGTVTPNQRLSIGVINNDGMLINALGTNSGNALISLTSSITTPLQSNSASISLINQIGDRALQFSNSSSGLSGADLIYRFINNSNIPIFQARNNGTIGINQLIVNNIGFSGITGDQFQVYGTSFMNVGNAQALQITGLNNSGGVNVTNDLGVAFSATNQGGTGIQITENYGRAASFTRNRSSGTVSTPIVEILKTSSSGDNQPMLNIFNNSGNGGAVLLARNISGTLMDAGGYSLGGNNGDVQFGGSIETVGRAFFRNSIIQNTTDPTTKYGLMSNVTLVPGNGFENAGGVFNFTNSSTPANTFQSFGLKVNSTSDAGGPYYGGFFNALGASTANRFGIYAEISGTNINSSSSAALFVAPINNFALRASGRVSFSNLPDETVPLSNTSGIVFSSLGGSLSELKLTGLVSDVLRGDGTFGLAPSGTIQGGGTTNGVAFFSNNNTITADGNNFMWDNTNKKLGIGTVAPLYNLSIYGGDINTNFGISIGHKGTGISQDASLILYTRSSGPSNLLGQPGSKGWEFAARGESYNLGNPNSLQFNYYTGSGWIQPLIIQPTGNIGMGTIFPQSKLDIVGGVAIGTYAGSVAAPANGIIVSGSVGIGTSSPSAKLEINQPAPNDFALKLTSSSTGFGSGILFENTNLPTKQYSIYTNNGGALIFGDENPPGAQRMKINITGDVVIGTGEPLNKLDVKGNLGVGAYAGLNTGPINGLIVSGNVGIGTPSPNSLLDVAGSTARAITSTSTNLTLDNTHSTVIVTGSTTLTITLPGAPISNRRVYTIVNNNSNATGISIAVASGNNYYIVFGGAITGTSIAVNSAITVQSNGTNWFRIQ